ncbi:MAG: BMP family ABC transporter substrate-binding protein [Chloroflexia bacterium]|nr:BMP family ABC transporter substrate-binding protein [Chloroflexia bacterium]
MARSKKSPLAGWSTILLLTILAGALLPTGRLTARPAQAQTVSVGLVTDEGTLADMSFNWLSYQGLLRAEDELGVAGAVYTSTSPADYEPNLQQCVDDGNDLCLSVGFSMADATWNKAQDYPGTAFAILDASWEDYPDNLRGILFASEEGAYLAGTLAGLMSDSDVLGDIGGMPIPPVDEYVYGFRNGAQCANLNANVLITYTWDFANPDVGAQVAQALMADGADIIFAPAGATGNGAVLTATQSGAWGVGVDVDYYTTVFMSGTAPGSDRLLTSAMKRLDNAVFMTIEDVVQGQFSPGTVRYDLAAGGVGLAPFHEADPLIPQEVRDALALVKEGLISGTIHPWDPCRSATRYVDGAMGGDDSDCSGPGDPCQSIAYAIEQAGDTDTILVAQGTYTENVWIDRWVTLEGGYEAVSWTRSITQYETIIDGSGNPMIEGDWDGNRLGAPRVISDSGGYRMWYDGYNESGPQRGWAIGLAESTNGLTWTKYAGNPVLRPGEEGSWDNLFRGQVAVLKDNGLYNMWYSGASEGPWETGYATSTNGISWSIYAGNPVLTVGGPGSWDEMEANGPAVLLDGSLYRMWYHGCNADYSQCSIGYATSTNGLDWNKYAGNPVLSGTLGAWDETAVLWPAVVESGGGYELWYYSNSQIGYATSADGVHWAKYPDPVLSESWYGAVVRNMSVLRENGDYKMWFRGGHPEDHGIGYAESVDGITWTRYLSNPVLPHGTPSQSGQSAVTFAEGSDQAVLDGFTITGGDTDAGAGLRITGETPPETTGTGFDFWASGCVTPSRGTAMEPSEAITVYVEGNDVVMSHTGAIYNCCATMVVDFEDQSPLLKLVERETYEDGPCYCLCPFNLSARISDLEPGEYEVEVWDEPNNRLVLSVSVTIPGGVGQGGPNAVSELSGILVQNCTISGNYALNWGGGVWVTNAEATIRDSVIAGNHSEGAPGIEVNHDLGPAHLVLEDCAVHDNAGYGAGGGLHVWGEHASAEVRSTQVQDNQTNRGGGLCISNGAWASLTGSTVRGNTAENEYGGGVRAEDNATLVISDSLIAENQAASGGGVAAETGSAIIIERSDILSNTAYDGGGGIGLWRQSSVTVRDSAIMGNEVGHGGGGIHVSDTDPNLSIDLTNCLVVGNRVGSGGAGLDNWGRATLMNVTLADNVCLNGCMGGLFNQWESSFATVTNSILWGNDGGDMAGEGHFAVDYSDVGSATVPISGSGNLSADPHLDGDYRLQAGSLCINSGTDTGAPDHDYEGDPRPFETTDMGADEWWPTAGLALAPPSSSGSAAPGETVVYTLTVSNLGNYSDSFALSAAGAWTSTLSTDTAGPLPAGGSLRFTLAISIPEDAADGAEDLATVTATSWLEPALSEQVQITTTAMRTDYVIYLPLLLRGW